MEIIGVIATVFAIIGGIYAFWKKIVVPRSRRHRLTRFYELVEDWFDEIDRSNIDDLSTTHLNNRENRIRAFIADNRLEHVRMSFSLSFRRQFLKSCGLKDEVCSDITLFEKFSRCPAEGLTLGMFWDILVGKFYTFQSRYRSGDPKTNFGDVEMSVKVLKMFTGAKAS